MEQILMAAHSIVKPRKNCGMIDCCMVRQDIDKHLYIVLVCAVAHSAEIVAVAEHIVSDSPVGRLIVIVPFSHHAVAGLTVERHTTSVADIACLDRRRLYVVISRLGDKFHVCRDSIETPCPCMENHLVLRCTRSGGFKRRGRKGSGH